MSHRTPQSKAADARVTVVDSLRGLAALMVCWYHLTNGNPAFLPDGWLKRSGAFGWLGVDVFFVISGFVLPYSMHRNGYRLSRDFGRFIVRRIIRLDPPYLATVLLTVALWQLSASLPDFRGTAPQISAAGVFAHVGYLNGFVGLPWLSPVFWSLAIEFQFYVVIALLLPLVASATTWGRIAALALFWTAALLGSSPTFLFPYLGMFGAGMACFQYLEGRLGRGSFLTTVGAMAIATSIALNVPSAVASFLTALVIAFARPGWGWGSSLGLISYSLYLIHVPVGGRVINAGVRLGTDGATRAGVLLLALVVSISAAWAFYRLVELPAQRWSARLRVRRPSFRDAEAAETAVSSA